MSATFNPAIKQDADACRISLRISGTDTKLIHDELDDAVRERIKELRARFYPGDRVTTTYFHRQVLEKVALPESALPWDLWSHKCRGRFAARTGS